MPAASDYNPDPNNKALRDAAEAEYSERQKASKRNWDYYRGKHKNSLLVEDGIDDNVKLNICRPAVDRRISFLFPEMPGLELDKEADTEPEQFLKDVWESLGGAVLMSQCALNGALNGQVYYRVNPSADDTGLPDVVNLNPANIITWWRDDDYREILWHELRWKAGKIDYRQDVVDMEGSWLIRDFKRGGNNQWELIREEVWQNELGPIVTHPHTPIPNEFYGESELFHAELNDSINRVASDVNKILRFHAGPRTIGTGVQGGKVTKTAVNNFWTIENENAKVYNLEMQSDLTASQNFLSSLIEMFIMQSRVTMISSSPDAFKGMTNLGIRAAFMDMIHANEVLRRMYGYGIQQVSQRILMLAGRAYEMPPKLAWGEALPVDHREEVDLIQKQKDMGLMSMQTASAQLHLDFEEEQRRIADEADIQGRQLDRMLNGQQPQFGGNGNGAV